MAARTFTDLRALAQSFGIPNVFQMSEAELRQAINMRQAALIPEPIEAPIVLPVDGRLLTKPVARKSDKAMIEETLQPFVNRGLRLEFPNDETWRMSWDKREDTGTIRQPLRAIVGCARRVLDGK